jgi:hypothetical protein
MNRSAISLHTLSTWLYLCFVALGIWEKFGSKYGIRRAVKSGKLSAEEGEKRIKRREFSGWYYMTLGIILLLLGLAG